LADSPNKSVLEKTKENVKKILQIGIIVGALV
jgi:hypothetical protein